MINPDFSNRTYTVEVLKSKSESAEAFDSVIKLTTDAKIEDAQGELTGLTVRVCHAFLSSQHAYHRFTRVVVAADGTERTIPRSKTIRGHQVSFYDVLIAQCNRHIVVAVPFHELAEEFFPRVDTSLGGTGTRYEKLDITAMVIRLGAEGVANVISSSSGDKIGLSVTRCHLAYADQQGRTSNLQQIRMTGTNLGASKEYRSLVAPVLNPRESTFTVTPVILGFALSADGVRKSSATTDRHGNFKLWISPGLRRLIRLFDLLATLDEMKNVTSTTTNIPIMQSKTIRDAED